MTEPIKVKRGDVGVIFDDTLTSNGDPIDLTDADVVFILRPLRATEPTVDAAAVVLDEEAGTVRYVSADGDLDVAGLYEQEWEVRYGSGDRFTVPSGGYNHVLVLGDLNPGDDGS